MKCAMARMADWRDSCCRGWFSYDFGIEKVGVVSANEVVSGKPDFQSDRCSIFEL